MTTETTQHDPNHFDKPINTESYIKSQKLTKKDDEAIEEILQLAAKKLHGLAEKATIQLQLIQVKVTKLIALDSLQSGAFLHLQSSNTSRDFPVENHQIKNRRCNFKLNASNYFNYYES